MATTNLTGSASFEFTAVAGMASPFLLAWPLELVASFEIAHPEMRWVWRSMDRSGRNVVTVEGAKADALAVIRRDDEPDRLREFLRLAMDGGLAALVYKKDSGAAGVAVDIDEVAGGTSVSLRPDRSGIGWETSIRLVMAETDVGSLL